MYMAFLPILVTLLCATQCLGDQHNGFILEVPEGRVEAEKIAEHFGFHVENQIDDLGLYHLVSNEQGRRLKRYATAVVSRLQDDSRVSYVAELGDLVREKRGIIHDKQLYFPIRVVDDKTTYQRSKADKNRVGLKDEIPEGTEIKFNDPYFLDQWYLNNDGQTGGTVDVDMNIFHIWKAGYTGKGVVTCILDDGIDHTHPDLQRNYDAYASADLNDQNDDKNDPMPNVDDPSNRIDLIHVPVIVFYLMLLMIVWNQNSHGTRCAGEIAAEADNDVCGVGVAYEARIGGIRMLDGRITDFLEACALSFKRNYIDIYSASWGPKDDGRTMEAPLPGARKALSDGVLKGRHGLGSIFVWATGNGGLTDDDCNCDGYVSSIETLSVGSINSQGMKTYFMETCPSTIAVVPTGGAESVSSLQMENTPTIKVVTTDLNGDCTLEFQGTSSAAPLAAGCIALVLQANGNLAWRDVQHLVVETSRIPATDDRWSINGAGYHVSHALGFGVLDCAKMVQRALTWTNVPAQHTCISEMKHIDREIKSRQSLTFTISSSGCSKDGDAHIDRLEHVQLYVKMDFSWRGDVQILLSSPSGTMSEMLSPRSQDDNDNGIDFTFMTVHNWGESPSGDWVVQIRDTAQQSGQVNQGVIKDLQLILYGYALEHDDHASHRSLSSHHASSLTNAEVKQIVEHELEQARAVSIPPLQPAVVENQNNQDNPEMDSVSDSSLNNTKSVKSLQNSLKTNLDKIIELLEKKKTSNLDENKRTFHDKISNTKDSNAPISDKLPLKKGLNSVDRSNLKEFVAQHRELVDKAIVAVEQMLDVLSMYVYGHNQLSIQRKEYDSAWEHVTNLLGSYKRQTANKHGKDDGLRNAWTEVRNLLSKANT